MLLAARNFECWEKGSGSIDGSFFQVHSPNIRLQATQCRGLAPQRLSNSVPRGIGRLSQAIRLKRYRPTRATQHRWYTMSWQEVCGNPNLQNLPFKIELNNQGQILMTQVKVYHFLFLRKIAGLLYSNLTDGNVLVECAISTKEGTKVADVAWASKERLKVIGNEVECSVAPDICIEIMSSTNTKKEMVNKRKLYFSNGATEVWVCDKNGAFDFFTKTGKSNHSLSIPNLPAKLHDA